MVSDGVKENEQIRQAMIATTEPNYTGGSSPKTSSNSSFARKENLVIRKKAWDRIWRITERTLDYPNQTWS